MPESDWEDVQAPAGGSDWEDVPTRAAIPAQPFGSTFPTKGQTENQTANILKWRDANNEVPPERSADVLRYSAASGLAPEFASDNLEDVRKNVDSNGVDWDHIASQRPALASYLLDKPHAQPALAGDYDKMSTLEWLITGKWEDGEMVAPPALAGATADAIAGVEKRYHILKKLTGLGAENPLETYVTGKWGWGSVPLGPPDVTGGLSLPVPELQQPPAWARFSGGHVDETKEDEAIARIREGFPATDYGTSSMSTGRQIAANVLLGPVKAAPLLIENILAGAVAGPAGMFAVNAAEGVAGGYEALSEARGPKGEKIDEDTARAGALATGLSSGALYTFGLGPLVSSIAKPFLTEASTVAASKALASPAVSQMLGKFALTFGEHAASGAATMALQTGVETGVRQLAEKSSYGKELNGGEIATSMADAFKTGLRDFLLVSAFGPARDFMETRGQIRAAEQSASRLEAMTDTVAGSKALERLPEAERQDLLSRMAKKDGAVKAAHIPVEEWSRYWQDKKVDPADAAAHVMDDGGKAYQEAQATGGNLSIPIEKYLSKIAKTEHAAGLAEDTSLDADAPTPRRAKQLQKELTTRMEEQSKARAPELEDGQALIRKAVTELVRGTGRSAQEAKDAAELYVQKYTTHALLADQPLLKMAGIGKLHELEFTGPDGQRVESAAADRMREAIHAELDKSGEVDFSGGQATIDPALANYRAVDESMRAQQVAAPSGELVQKGEDPGSGGEGAATSTKYGHPAVAGLETMLSEPAHPVEFSRSAGTPGDVDLNNKPSVEKYALDTFRDQSDPSNPKPKPYKTGDGKTIEVGGPGIEHTVYPNKGGSTPESLRVLLQLPEAISRARLVSEGEGRPNPKKPNRKVTGTEVFIAPVLFDGERHVARFMVERVLAGGKERSGLYSLVAIETEREPSARDAVGPAGGTPTQGVAPWTSGDPSITTKESQGQTGHVWGDFLWNIRDERNELIRDPNTGAIRRPDASGDYPAITKGAGGELKLNLEAKGTINEGNARGALEVSFKGGEPVRFNLNVFKGADPATVAHESAHFFSWSLHHIAASDFATPEMKEDYQALIKFAGYDSPEARLAETREHAALSKKVEAGDATPQEKARLLGLTAKEERISHGFEQYLSEGKAPTPALQRVFSRFKDWMLRIYQGLQKQGTLRQDTGAEGIQEQFRRNYGEELGVSDEVRAVFDRWFAVDASLKEADRQSGFEPFAPAVDLMTPDQRVAYSKALEARRLSAEQDVAQRLVQLRDGKVEEARGKVTQAVTQDVDSDPVNRAQRFLSSGELPDGQGGALPKENLPSTLLDADGRPIKLSRKVFVKEFGADAARRMPRGSFHPEKAGGLAPEEMATRLGYESAQEMVSALRNAPPRDGVIRERTQAQLDSMFGSALQVANEAALSAVASPEALDVTLKELRAMATDVNPSAAQRVRTINIADLRATASRLVDQTPVGELDPAKYARAERKAALQAAELWGAGKKEEAIAAKERRLLNQALHMEARDRAEEAERARQRIADVSDDVRAKLGKADPAYRNAHDAISAAVGLSEAGPEAKGGLDAFLKLATDDAQAVAFDADALRALVAEPKDWDALTVSEAREVADAATNVRHLAKQSLEVQVAGKTMGKDMFLAELAKRAASTGREVPLEPSGKTAQSRQNLWVKARKGVRSAVAQFENIETFAHILDGGDTGPFHDLLVNSRLEARAKEVALTKDVLVKLRDAFSKMPKEVLKRRAETVDLGGVRLIPGRSSDVYTRDQLWMLFLNSGNEGNLQRLRDGNGLSDTDRTKALSLLAKPEMDFLQGVLNTVGSLHPELAASYERRTGVPLGKVEASPIEVNGQTYEGGYFPLKYRSESAPGQMQDINAIKDLFPSNRPPGPERGHTKARQDKVNVPLDLEWSTLQAHLANVIHDISYSDWVRDTGSVVLKPRIPGPTPSFGETVSGHVGAEREKQVLPWLRDVASARADSVSQHVGTVFDQFGGFARRKMALGMMAFNFPVMGRHSLDAFRTMLEKESISPITVSNAYRQMLSSDNRNSPLIAQSKEIAYHEAKHDENLRQEIEKMGGASGVSKKLEDLVSHTGFWAQRKLDAFTTRVAFKAAYDHSIDSGYLPDEAVQRADDVLRRAFPSGDIAEKPPLARSKQGWASALMFTGWANNSYNALSRRGHGLINTLGADGSVMGKMGAVAQTGAVVIASGAIEALGMYLAGRGPSKDDSGSDKALWAIEEALLAPVDTIPVAGPMFKDVVLHRPINPAVDPSMAMAAEYGKIVLKFFTTSTKETTVEEKMFHALEMGLTALGLGGVARRTVGAAGKMYTGEVEPDGPIDAAGNLLYGVKKKPVSTPASALQSLIGGH